MPGEVPAALTAGLAAIAARGDGGGAARWRRADWRPRWRRSSAGLQAVRAVRSQLASRAIAIPDDARFEIDSRLERKERQFVDAVLAAGSVRLEALADDGLVVAGQPVKVTVIVANRGASPIAVKQIGFRGLRRRGRRLQDRPGGGGLRASLRGAAARSRSRRASPRQYWKRLPDAARYQFEPDAPFGLPFRPTPFRVQFDLEIGGAAIAVERDVQHRYEGNIFSGEKRMELTVVPRLAVSLTPEIAILPASQGAAGRSRGRAGASCGSR